MAAIVNAVLFPFRLTRWLLYWLCAILGHPAMFVPGFYGIYLAADGDRPMFVWLLFLLILTNRLLHRAARFLAGPNRLRIPKVPKPAKLPTPQAVSIIVRRHAAPSERTMRRHLPAELRSLLQ